MQTRFRVLDNSGIRLWEGNLDCQAAHDAILEQLLKNVIDNELLTDAQELTIRQRGNIGEFICFQIGVHRELQDCHAFPANAAKPLSDISSSDFDIVWLYFGQHSTDDYAILQEVKTTGNPDLHIAYSLTTDYAKLFGTNASFTLAARFMAIKTLVEHTLKKPELVPRVDALLAQSAAACTRCRLKPSLVHEKTNADPVARLTAVKTSLVTAGWNNNSISPMSVSLTDLEDRLQRIARGQN